MKTPARVQVPYNPEVAQYVEGSEDFNVWRRGVFGFQTAGDGPKRHRNGRVWSDFRPLGPVLKSI